MFILYLIYVAVLIALYLRYVWPVTEVRGETSYEAIEAWLAPRWWRLVGWRFNDGSDVMPNPGSRPSSFGPALEESMRGWLETRFPKLRSSIGASPVPSPANDARIATHAAQQLTRAEAPEALRVAEAPETQERQHPAAERPQMAYRSAASAMTEAKILNARGRVKAFGILTILSALLALLVSTMFVIRLRETSEMAIRFNSYVQEQLAYWMISSAGLWILTVILAVLWMIASGQTNRMTRERIAIIRGRLASIEDEIEERGESPKSDLRSERNILESELRQLGA